MQGTLLQQSALVVQLWPYSAQIGTGTMVGAGDANIAAVGEADRVIGTNGCGMTMVRGNSLIGSAWS
jgi:hypothetical protein